MKVKDIFVPIKFNWLCIFMPLFLIIKLGIVDGIITSILFFLSTLFHEYSHVFEAKRQKLYVPYIEFNGIGAAACVFQDELDYGRVIRVSSAGPIGSLYLGLFSMIVYWFFPNFWIGVFTIINFILFGFNILPLYPSDGGRIFNAFMGYFFGPLPALGASLIVSGILYSIGILLALKYELYVLSIVFIILLAHSYFKNMEARRRLCG